MARRFSRGQGLLTITEGTDDVILGIVESVPQGGRRTDIASANLTTGAARLPLDNFLLGTSSVIRGGHRVDIYNEDITVSSSLPYKTGALIQLHTALTGGETYNTSVLHYSRVSNTEGAISVRGTVTPDMREISETRSDSNVEDPGANNVLMITFVPHNLAGSDIGEAIPDNAIFINGGVEIDGQLASFANQPGFQSVAFSQQSANQSQVEITFDSNANAVAFRNRIVNQQAGTYRLSVSVLFPIVITHYSALIGVASNVQNQEFPVRLFAGDVLTHGGNAEYIILGDSA